MAVHQACASLDDGESDLALAGGVAVILEPRKSVAGSLQGLLSPTGRCHAFDVAADGFVSGEGCVVLLLKRLPDALRDGDRVLAVVRGTAANQDGRTVNIAAPSEQAQVALYQKALAAGGVDPSTVGMIEAHGTGTPIGDPVEYASLAAVYGVEGPCALASVKTNFGHMQSTSGALGMMKAILALQHDVVPQNLHFTRLPDQMAEIKTELFVPQANTPWPTNGRHPRRAAVSAYGMSGTNVHAVLEQAPAQAPDKRRQAPERRRRRKAKSHCRFRYRRHPPSNCASRPPGWRTGSTSTVATRACGIWVTRCRAAAHTSRCGRWCRRAASVS